MSSLSAEQLEALRHIDSPTVSNAIEQFNVRSFVEGYADEAERVRRAERDVLEFVRRPGLTVERLRAFQAQFKH